MEAMIDANKPIIMKNAVHARKSFIRKTKSFKLRKDRDKRQRHSKCVFGFEDNRKICNYAYMCVVCIRACVCVCTYIAR